MTIFFLEIWCTKDFKYRQPAQKISWHYLQNCGFFSNVKLLVVISLFFSGIKKGEITTKS